jgi:hypothetical protein
MLMAADRRSLHPKAKGDITTAKVMAALLASGHIVLVPWGDNQRYDLVVEVEKQFHRIQCKTGRLLNGCIVFNSSSTGNPNSPYRQNYKGQVELFGVYSVETDKCYLVPVDAVPPGEAKLRIMPTKNNQSKGITWASQFEI